MKHSKIAVVGAGSVGSTTAYALLLKNIAAEIILIDIDATRCAGEVFDLTDALPFCRSSIIREGKLQEAGQADIIIIAAGIAQKPGQSRSELIEINKKVILQITDSMKPIKKSALVIMITNPLDILTRYMQEHVELPYNQVFGSGTFLDTQRLRETIAQKLNISAQSVNAYMLGEHGDTQFAAWSCAQIDGMPLSSFSQFTPEFLTDIETEVRNKAYEIIACKGSTFFGIATCVASICETIIFNKRLILPLSTFIKQFDICISLPVLLAENGIEQVYDIPLNQQEKNKLHESVKQLQNLKKEISH